MGRSWIGGEGTARVVASVQSFGTVAAHTLFHDWRRGGLMVPEGSTRFTLHAVHAVLCSAEPHMKGHHQRG